MFIVVGSWRDAVEYEVVARLGVLESGIEGEESRVPLCALASSAGGVATVGARDAFACDFLAVAAVLQCGIVVGVTAVVSSLCHAVPGLISNGALQLLMIIGVCVRAGALLSVGNNIADDFCANVPDNDSGDDECNQRKHEKLHRGGRDELYIKMAEEHRSSIRWLLHHALFFRYELFFG